MKFDWTINAGTVLSLVVIFVAFFSAHTQNITKISEMKTKLDIMFDWFVKNVHKTKEN